MTEGMRWYSVRHGSQLYTKAYEPFNKHSPLSNGHGPQGVPPILAPTYTQTFDVYLAKRFPCVPDTNALSIRESGWRAGPLVGFQQFAARVATHGFINQRYKTSPGVPRSFDLRALAGWWWNTWYLSMNPWCI
ncbi:hypothetical protein BGW80DRAFT_1256660 [Lactifluus volemus]|nr:hypothetical protein BGW80DRAFT_1256660 [Lactifluus volemus]